MALLNKKSAAEKQIRHITKQLKANGAIINQIAKDIAVMKGKARRLPINPNLN